MIVPAGWPTCLDRIDCRKITTKPALILIPTPYIEKLTVDFMHTSLNQKQSSDLTKDVTYPVIYLVQIRKGSLNA